MSLRLKLALVFLVALLLPALAAVEARLVADGQRKLASAMDGLLVVVAITLVVLLTLGAGDVVRWGRAAWRTGRLTGSPRAATDVRADVESVRPRT